MTLNSNKKAIYNLPDYDFLGSIYKNTKVSELEEALKSIHIQTHLPKNVILVLDGFVEKKVIELVDEYTNILPIKKIPLKNNSGLGIALRTGLLECQSKIVLRFDTDDINLKRRAELIVTALENEDVDIVGSNVFEFENNPQICKTQKKMPLTHKDISRAIIFRNPINHPSVGFLRNSILKINGGYRHFPFYEDYDLWIRALYSGLKFKNIDEELVALRITNQRARRRGIKHVFSELKLLVTFLNHSFLNGLFFIPSCFARIIFALLPLEVISFIYKRFLRTKIKN